MTDIVDAMNRGPHGAQGFTLIELMVTVAIVGILLAIGIPSYREFILRANRSEAIAQLTRVATEQERFLYRFGRYAGSITAARTLDPATSGLALAADTRGGAGDDAYYTLSLELTNGGLGFELRAEPVGKQIGDRCGVFTLSHSSERGAASEGCW